MAKKVKKKPQNKGVVKKAIILNPKKPNSASRRCVVVTLNETGKQVIAYVPGEGHNYTEYTSVFVRPSNRRDLPGVNYDVIRKGEHAVKNRRQGRSKVGAKKPKKI
jgi:small subunit ribosomal protein S12